MTLFNIVKKQLDDDRRIGRLETADHPAGLVDALAQFLALPGLRGFWPMSAVGVAGQAIDMQGLGNHLTRNGDPEFNYDNLAPYCDYDGTGDYHNITDAASANAFDILGNEGYIKPAIRGLTAGAWVKTSTDAVEGIICKDVTLVAQDAYALYFGPTPTFRVSDGAAYTTIAAPATAINQWHHIAGRYVPSVSVDVYVDGIKTSNVGAIPAAPINNSVHQFTLANFSAVGVLELTGFLSMCFICAAALSDKIINSLYQKSRRVFEV